MTILVFKSEPYVKPSLYYLVDMAGGVEYPNGIPSDLKSRILGTIPPIVYPCMDNNIILDWEYVYDGENNEFPYYLIKTDSDLYIDYEKNAEVIVN